MSAYSSPLPATEVYRYARILRNLLRSLDRQVVHTAIVGYGEADLLCPVGEEVDRVGEFLDCWVGAAPEAAHLSGRGLAVLDAFEDELLSGAEHGGGSPLNVSPESTSEVTS